MWDENAFQNILNHSDSFIPHRLFCPKNGLDTGLGLYYPPVPEQTLGEKIIMDCGTGGTNKYDYGLDVTPLVGTYRYTSIIFGYLKNVEIRRDVDWSDWCSISELEKRLNSSRGNQEIQELLDITPDYGHTGKRKREENARQTIYNKLKRKITDKGGVCPTALNIGNDEVTTYIDFLGQKIVVKKDETSSITLSCNVIN